ncbi:SDR family NAD(P)-dependent oxidoreductase [Cohnella sp. GCM10020058]|uniref:SDR family NAD(P)-dependent oxidoreductase n=1 Tax=Cohnella sp. GCM10020058 TaxID=3317330 RepID=UPI0036294DBB
MKTALVTGGSRGIGQGIALRLAKEGYRVAFGHWNDDERAARTAAEIEAISGEPCPVFPIDLGSQDGALELAKQAIDALGHVDLLVNNAGICGFAEFVNEPIDMMDQMIAINYRAPIILMREFSDRMVDNGIKGAIVNISSSRGTRAYPGDAVYGGLKAGLERSTESIALSLAPYGIRVNCVAPGAIHVNAFHKPGVLGECIPLGRIGEPDDVAQAVMWLASEQASYVTGITLRVDGGLILPGMPEDGKNNWGTAVKPASMPSSKNNQEGNRR